jgi:hypothetical protein
MGMQIDSKATFLRLRMASPLVILVILLLSTQSGINKLVPQRIRPPEDYHGNQTQNDTFGWSEKIKLAIAYNLLTLVIIAGTESTSRSTRFNIKGFKRLALPETARAFFSVNSQR